MGGLSFLPLLEIPPQLDQLKQQNLLLAGSDFQIDLRLTIKSVHGLFP
jgi:hypothetical protein